MSKIKIEKIMLQNFKCHKKFDGNLKNLNILTGSNAAGKSSFIQAILLAIKSWEEHDKKQINTNEIYGLNLGIPANILSEDFEGKEIVIKMVLDGEEYGITLGLPEEDEKEMYFQIINAEEIAVQFAGVCSMKKLQVFFLSAERKGPRIISAIKKIIPYSVGSIGENTGYLIDEMDKRQKLNSNFCLPADLKISSIERFSANCEEWLNVIIPGTGIQYSIDIEKNFTSLRFCNQGEFYLPVATGFGITYVLPIIVQALAASVIGNSVLMIENPEAHLHPLSQSRLGKFLALVSANGVQVIVETHSEHIIDGCRIQAASENQCENIRIMFFEKREMDSICKTIIVAKDGELEEWPVGFFDQKRQDLRELLEMRRCGN